MHIISPTILQKKKLKEMILRLFPEYQYVKFGSNGLISLSKSFWYFIFKRETVHISELCTVYIPERLEKLENKTKMRVYNIHSHIVLDLLHYKANGVIDYLYDEYINIKYRIHKICYTKSNILPEKSYSLSTILLGEKKDSLVLSRLSNVHIKEALKHWKDAVFVLNHPVLRSKILDLWFNSEIKKELRRIYNVRIAYA